MNAVEIEEAISLLSEQDFNPTEFPYSFLEAFGNKSTTIARLRTGNNNKSDIERGVLQHNNIHIAVCDDGEVSETLKTLKESTSPIIFHPMHNSTMKDKMAPASSCSPD